MENRPAVTVAHALCGLMNPQARPEFHFLGDSEKGYGVRNHVFIIIPGRHFLQSVPDLLFLLFFSKAKTKTLIFQKFLKKSCAEKKAKNRITKSLGRKKPSSRHGA